MLQQEQLTEIWNEAASTIQINPVNSGRLAESNGSNIWMSPASNNVMSIHTTIYDLFGNPGVVLTLKHPRQIYVSGLQSINSFQQYFLAVTMLISGASLLFVNQSILVRISLLTRNIRAIGRSKDLSIRIGSSGKDEFSDVEQEFNRMIDSLEQAQEELQLQAMLDPLTQLPNRSLFFAKLNEAIASIKGTADNSDWYLLIWITSKP